MRLAPLLALLLALTFALAACGGDSDETPAQTTAPAPAVAAATPVPTAAATAEPIDPAPAESAPADTPVPEAPAPTAEPEPASAARLSANDASIAELTAAFEAANISNARRWAREVDEYRPYDVDDTDYAKLRGELAKYNPAPGVVDAIIAELELP